MVKSTLLRPGPGLGDGQHAEYVGVLGSEEGRVGVPVSGPWLAQRNSLLRGSVGLSTEEDYEI